MTEEEKKKLEELEAENKRLKEELEKKKQSDDSDKKAKVKRTEDAPKKNGEYNDATSKAMMAKLEEMESQLKQAKVDRFCDAIKDKVPAGIMDKAKALADGVYSAVGSSGTPAAVLLEDASNIVRL